ncbi:hypothetical protein E4U49_000835 [Claviceps purpurea]|nr:hypothetical protein E4U49_000835 [Claviceps purpurea]
MSQNNQRDDRHTANPLISASTICSRHGGHHTSNSTIDIPLSDPEMAPFLGSPAHICGALFACIPSLRQSESSEYIRSRQRSRFAGENGAADVRGTAEKGAISGSLNGMSIVYSQFSKVLGSPSHFGYLS